MFFGGTGIIPSISPQAQRERRNLRQGILPSSTSHEIWSRQVWPFHDSRIAVSGSDGSPNRPPKLRLTISYYDCYISHHCNRRGQKREGTTMSIRTTVLFALLSAFVS